MLDDALMRKLVDEKEFSGDELFNLSHHRFIMFEFIVKEWHAELFNVLAEFYCMLIIMAGWFLISSYNFYLLSFVLIPSCMSISGHKIIHHLV
jgi:hypothetical protein